MDKLDRYLDQVCRRIGGPRSLRVHIRRELREHLLDAAAEHRAAGLAEEEALQRALDDFGAAEQMRSELEAAHGHRLLPLVIDKAMQWKEKTMKARGFWSTWAHVMLFLVIVMEMSFIAAAMIFVEPKVQQIVYNLDVERRGMDTYMPRSQEFLGLLHIARDNGLWIILAVAIAWGLFEWRVRSENKSLIRLSILGTLAVGLIFVVIMTAAVISIPTAIAASMLSAQKPDRIASNQLIRIDSSIGTLDQAVATRDWNAILRDTSNAGDGLQQLSQSGGAAPSIITAPQQARVDALRAAFDSGYRSLYEARNAAIDKDPARLDAAMRKFHEAYATVQAATRPAP